MEGTETQSAEWWVLHYGIIYRNSTQQHIAYREQGQTKLFFREGGPNIFFRTPLSDFRRGPEKTKVSIFLTYITCTLTHTSLTQTHKDKRIKELNF